MVMSADMGAEEESYGSGLCVARGPAPRMGHGDLGDLRWREERAIFPDWHRFRGAEDDIEFARDRTANVQLSGRICTYANRRKAIE